MAGSINRRAVRWLRGQLPELVAAGAISSGNADAIERYYEGAEARRRNFGFVLLASVGSALVGAGIVLLIAHNWDELSRGVRTAIAFLPLLLAQALAVFVLLRRNESAPWREAVAVLDIGAVATAISLISQTYQIQGSFAEFLQTWLLLILPVVYIFRTTLGAIVYLGGAVLWRLNRVEIFSEAKSPNFFWLLLLLLLPYIWTRYKSARDSRETVMLVFVFAVALMFGVGSTAGFARANAGGIAFAGLATLIYLGGMKLFPRPSGRLSAIALLGGVGIGVMAMVLSFEGMWHLRAIAWNERDAARNLSLAIELVFPIAAIALAVLGIARKRAAFSISAAALPVIAAIAWLVAVQCPYETYHPDHCSFTAAAIMNVYALLLGVDILARGIRVDSFARANFGLLLLAGLALCRFFDSDLSFLTRGIGFIVVGLGFLAANVVLFKKRAAT